MCFGSGGGGDNGAAAAAAASQQQTKMMEDQQAKHDSNVNAGKSSIDRAFSQFDPAYFDTYKKSYLDAANPQLKDQYGIARDKLIASLAGRDTLESSVGANSLAQLDKTRDNTAIDIGNKATDATNQFKGHVDQTKSSLYAQNASAADPLTAASEAQSQAGALVSPQSYPTLTDVFAGALAPFATGVKTNSQSMNPVFGGQQQRNAPSGMGSAIIG